MVCSTNFFCATLACAQQQTYGANNPYGKQSTPQNNTWNQPQSNSWGKQQPNQAAGQTDWNRPSTSNWSTQLPPVNIPPPIVVTKLPQLSAGARCAVIATVLPSAVAGLSIPTGYVLSGLVASTVWSNYVDVHACADAAVR